MDTKVKEKVIAKSTTGATAEKISMAADLPRLFGIKGFEDLTLIQPTAYCTHQPKAFTKSIHRTGTSGLREKFTGYRFCEPLMEVVGPGYSTAIIQLTGWKFDFRKKDHHIDMIELRFDNFDYSDLLTDGVISWKVKGAYKDKNGDDDFYWQVWWSVVAFG